MCRGLRGAARRLVVKEIIQKNKAQIVKIQESKISSLSDQIVREVWGIRFVKWACVDAFWLLVVYWFSGIADLLTSLTLERRVFNLCWWEIRWRIASGWLHQFMVWIQTKKELTFGRNCIQIELIGMGLGVWEVIGTSLDSLVKSWVAVGYPPKWSLSHIVLIPISLYVVQSPKSGFNDKIL